MKSAFTIKQLEKLQAEGKIRGFVIPLKPKRTQGQQKVKSKGDKAKAWIGWNLLVWAKENGFTLETEYEFSQRKFRFDWALVKKIGDTEIRIAIEYEGLISEKSGHTTVTGYTKDTEKYNLAQALGYKVIRFTALNYLDLNKELKKYL